MATQPDDDDFGFEIEEDTPVSGAPDKPEIEIEDDTPEADRGREPMPAEIVNELEADDLEEYSEKVKMRLKQMKKVWHDERREKERLQREQTEALSVAHRLVQENNQLKSTLSQGEATLITTARQAAELEAAQARREYKEAYEAGDSDRLVDAQDKLSTINLRLQQLGAWQPTLQYPTPEIQFAPQPVQAPRLDQKTIAWQERNTWWGNDPEMTASALGLHQKLVNERGPQYAGTDEYWGVIDKTMRRRFPDYFGDDEVADGNRSVARGARAANVVAPASRSRSPKKIVLRQSQISIAKKLGLTPEQYARELMKTEN
jgi:hypothetical protein